MHGALRTYSGAGAKELFDLLESRKSEVEGVMRGVPGFGGYYLVRTPEGGFSVTLNQDKAGADASVKAAADWVKKNATATHVAPPTVWEGAVIIHFD